MPAPGMQHGDLPLSQEAYMRVFANTTFALIPVGDSPSRISMWDCLRRGCVPVLFSTCPTTHALASHRGWLPPDDSRAFGVRAWSVLLNQTEVMTSDSYLVDALDAVSDEQLHAMRAAVRPYLKGMSYATSATEGDAVDRTVEMMLKHTKGGPQAVSSPPAHFHTIGKHSGPTHESSLILRSPVGA